MMRNFLLLVVRVLCYHSLVRGTLRALILSVDNRPLVSDYWTTNYASLAAVINFHYAKHHHYDFLFVSGVMKNSNDGISGEDNDVVSRIVAKYNISLHDLPPVLKGESRHDSKFKIDSFNVKLKQFRAASWSKLLIIWNLLQQRLEQKYDYILYIDSDAVVSPVRDQKHRSLDSFFAENELPGRVEFGPPPRAASMLFFSNFPFATYPCAGIVLFSVKHPFTDYLVREWWNQDIPFFNFNHDFEQSALRKMIFDSHVIIGCMTLLKERQFQPINKPYSESQWLHHFGTYVSDQRIDSLRSLINNHMNINGSSFTRIIEDIRTYHSLSVNLLEIAERMANFNYESVASKLFANQSSYYLARAPNRNGIFKIQYGMKRNVSEEAFNFWKFRWRDVKEISDEYLDSLILGPSVTTTSSMEKSVI